MNWRPDPGHLALLQEFIRSRVAAGDSDQDIRDRLVLRHPGYRAQLERMRADGATDDEIRSSLDWWWTLEFVGNTTIPQYIETARLLAPYPWMDDVAADIGATPDEITAALRDAAPPGGTLAAIPWTARVAAGAFTRAELVELVTAWRARQGAEPRPGPRPLVERADVLAARAELEAAGLPAGERSIAARLGVSRDAVRYALGKDRS